MSRAGTLTSPAHCCVRGSWSLWLHVGAQESGQLGGVDGASWERREDVGDDALEIGVEVIGAREWHGLQACPGGIGCGVVQAEQGTLLCEREISVLAVEVEGVSEKARGAGGEGRPGRKDGGVVGYYRVLSVWPSEAAE